MQKIVNASRVAVIGAGGFGTALSFIITHAGYSVNLWARRDIIADEINTSNTNKTYLPDCEFELDMVHATTSLKEALAQTDIVFLSMPSRFLMNQTDELIQYIQPNQIIVSAIKGFVADETCFLIESYMNQALNQKEKKGVQTAVLNGPNLAKEIILKQKTAMSIASKNRQVMENVKLRLSAPWMSLEFTDDLIGTQIAGTLKNVYAIGYGLLDSLDSGDNTKSLFLTRSLNEMKHFIVKMGGCAESAFGISGLGDLLTTCHSSLSRNHRLGIYLGQGHSLKESEALLKGSPEGVKTLFLYYNKIKELNLNFPIAFNLIKLLEGQINSIQFLDTIN